MLFLLNCLRSNKLLELHHIERKISGNLLDRKQSSKKKSIVCRFNKFAKKKIIIYNSCSSQFYTNKFKFLKIKQFLSNHTLPISLPTRNLI